MRTYCIKQFNTIVDDIVKIWTDLKLTSCFKCQNNGLLCRRSKWCIDFFKCEEILCSPKPYSTLTANSIIMTFQGILIVHVSKFKLILV